MAKRSPVMDALDAVEMQDKGMVEVLRETLVEGHFSDASTGRINCSSGRTEDRNTLVFCGMSLHERAHRRSGAGLPLCRLCSSPQRNGLG
jgi:hypothetical protein